MARYETLPRAIVFSSGEERKQFLEQEDYNVDLEKAASEFENIVKNANSESEIQNFLEKYPHFLPGFTNYHLGPAARAIVTKLSLGHDYVTDFAFLAQNSMEVCLTAVEIESPTKKVFTKAGDFSSDYNKARQQVVDWVAWADSNKQQAFDCFGQLGTNLWNNRLSKRFQAYLVIGDSKEFTSKKEQERWIAESSQRSRGIEIMSYDRLVKMSSLASIFYNKRLLVCSYKDRELRVKRVAG